MSTNGRKVGIREVASAAGVSVTTVSHALNGKGRLPAETREHVRRIAEELAYRPSVAARNLGGGRTGMLGLVISQPSGISAPFSDFAYFTQLMMAASTAAVKAGYALVLTPPAHGLGESAGVVVDGAIVIDPVAGDPLIEQLLESEVPLVTTGRILDEPEPHPWVDNDHIAGANSVLNHLARRGARRIALMTSPTVMSYTFDVESAYRTWCTDHTVKPLVTQVRADLTETAGYSAASQLFAMPARPDAIYATYDRLGVGALLAARAAGIAVPDDLLIAVTATESGSARSSRPSLTGLSLHPDQIGQRAADLLIELIEGRRPKSTHITVPTRLISRTSTRRRRAAIS
ncbi:MAG: LacI family DNA-binding transcriptional regulator [Solirubrobacteraceae bacterium]